MTDNLQIINIERALKGLSEEERGKNRAHASLFTLILYSQKGERDLYFRKSIDAVISKFPCRLILVTREKNGENYLRSSVSSTAISSSLFCEKISIDVGGEFDERVPSLILPHLLPDLPVYMIWSDVPEPKNPLIRYAKRVIIDPEISPHFQKCAKILLDFECQIPCEIGDLSWSSLRGWRKIISETFREEEWTEYLAETREITLTYLSSKECQIPFPEVRALYLQAFFATSLNWQFVHSESIDGTLTLTYENQKGKKIIVRLVRNYESLPLPIGRVLSLELFSDFREGHFLFKRNREKRQIFLTISDKDRCLLPFYIPLIGAKEGEEIIEELFYPTQKAPYLKILKLLSQIPR